MKLNLVSLILLFLILISPVTLANSLPLDLKNDDYNSSHIDRYSLKVIEIDNAKVKSHTDELNMTNPLIQIYFNSSDDKNDSTVVDSTVKGALIGAGAVLFSGLISYLMQIKGLKEQQRFEREKWKRDQLQEIYSNCIKHLSSSQPNDEEVKKYLYLVLIYNKNRDDYNNVKKMVDSYMDMKSTNFNTISQIKEETIDYIFKLASEDLRLQLSDKK